MKIVSTQYCVHEPVKILFMVYDRGEWPSQIWVEYRDAKRKRYNKNYLYQNMTQMALMLLSMN
jgi:hypothetical protein